MLLHCNQFFILKNLPGSSRDTLGGCSEKECTGLISVIFFTRSRMCLLKTQVAES